MGRFPFVFEIMISNLGVDVENESRGSGFLPVQSGLWHSLLSAQWPRHSDPPWAAAEHCLVLCWVPLAQVTEQSLQELHSCHCPSTEAPTTTQQARPKWRVKEGRHKQEEIFRLLFSLRLKANNTDINWRATCYMNTCLFWGDVLWLSFFGFGWGFLLASLNFLYLANSKTE